MEERDLYTQYSDEEVEVMISKLSPAQIKIFVDEIIVGKTRRNALFIATSFDHRYGRERI